MKSEAPCCGSFALSGEPAVFCSDKPVGECEGALKGILKKMHEGCIAKKPDEAENPPPLTCGTDEEYKEQAAEAAGELFANSPEAAAELAAKMLEDLLANMPVSGADLAAAALAAA